MNGSNSLFVCTDHHIVILFAFIIIPGDLEKPFLMPVEGSDGPPLSFVEPNHEQTYSRFPDVVLLQLVV
jgi:hypothetical protein